MGSLGVSLAAAVPIALASDGNVCCATAVGGCSNTIHARTPNVISVTNLREVICDSFSKKSGQGGGLSNPARWRQ